MGKRCCLQISVVLDIDDAEVVDMYVVTDGIGCTEYVRDGVDDPETIGQALTQLRGELICRTHLPWK